jgi:hypothetical protein
MSTLKVDTIQNISGVEVYTVKSWVNFDGTGTVAIRASGNVSSITDNNVGNYTVNFSTSISDANYAVSSYGKRADNNDLGSSAQRTQSYVITKTTSNFNTLHNDGNSGSLYDAVLMDFAVFR